MLMRLRRGRRPRLGVAAILMTLALVLGLGAQSAVAAPAPPTGLTANSQTTATYLSMSWNSVSGAVGYRLMYSTKADMSTPFYRNITSGLTGGYGGLTPGTTYYVKIKALTSTGADLTAYSAAVTAKTLRPMPASPTGLKAVSSTATYLTMGWNSVSGAVGYRLMYSTKSDMSAPFYRNVASGLTTGYGGLTPATTYYVKIKALNSAGADLTAYSAAVTAKTLVAPPAPPAGFKSTFQSTTTLSFSWGAVPNASQYRLALSSKADMSAPTYTTPVTTAGEVRGLLPATPYYAQVRALSATGAGITAYSAVVKATTAAVPVLPAIASPLSVASFNIRCATCVEGLPEEKTWADRRGAVVQTIVSKMPDIIGIQEASHTWLNDPRPGGYTQFEDLRDRLTAAGAAYKLTNSNRNNCVDSRLPANCVYADQGASAGTKIFYNSKTVKLVRSGSKMLPAASATANPRYVAWAEVVQLSTGKRLFFADTHLEIGKEASSNDLRKRQAQAVLDTIKSQNSGNLPVVLVGDMNSNKWTEPANGPYDVVTAQGLVDPLGNTYKSWYPSGAATAEKVVNRRVNSWNGFERTVRQGAVGTSGTYIDYIFTSKMRVPYYENVAKIDVLGSYVGTMPSDHNMQFATVGLP
jgi:endonuclease/exonuclease/phosphatase family metal-dependent hydrolase